MPDDPLALGCRRDLKRINAWMGNAKIVARAMRSLPPSERAEHIVELGAGVGGAGLVTVAAAHPVR